MFQVSPLRRDQFEDVLRLDDESLRRLGARRYVADRKPGFPCRVSLQDAEIGEGVVLLPYQHQVEESPLRAVIRARRTTTRGRRRRSAA